MDTPEFDALAKQYGVTLPPSRDEPKHELRPVLDEEYVYTDPVTDENYPRITGPDFDAPDRFPDDWGTRPTERDQAAITAGNA